MSSGNQPDGDSPARELTQTRPLDGNSNDPKAFRPISEAEWAEAAALYQGDPRGLELGHCVILDKLGADSKSLVFKARHHRLGCVVALKILPPAVARNRMTAMRLKREIETIAGLKHPNIVAALEADEDRGIPFLVMEYVEGHNLAQVVRDRGPLPVGEAIDLLIQAARGLEAAHSHGIVHRNIKPSNLMLDSAGVVRLLDLGVASMVDASNPFGQPAGGRMTECGMSRETIDFMAPELAEDSRRADHRADIYSLGCILYFLLTGREPFVGDTVLKRLTAHQEKSAPILRVLRPDAPSALEDAFQKMMARRPSDRPESMTAVIALLEASAVAAAGSPARAAEPTKSSMRTNVVDQAAIRRSATPKSGRESSMVSPDGGSEGSRMGSGLNLDDLVGDVRSELPIPSISTPTIQRTLRSNSPFPKRPVRPAILVAMAALAVLGAAFLRFVVFSRPSSTERHETSRATTDSKGVLADTRGGPKSVEVRPIPQPQETVRTIFDGKTGKGWMLTNRRPLPPDRVQPDGLNPHGTGSYLVVYEKKLGDFVLDFEYKLSKGCKSGVFLRVGDLSDPVNSSIEVALDDTTGTSYVDSGAFYDLVAPNENVQKPAGQWNQMTITAAGPVLAVSLNGKDVSRINLDEWTVRGKRPDGTDHQFQEHSLVDLPRRGYIGLQDHGSDCWFRNITLKTRGSPLAR